MRTSRFTNREIAVIVNQYSAGVPSQTLCCEHGISTSTLYKWRRGSKDHERLIAETRQEALDGIEAVCERHRVNRCEHRSVAEKPEKVSRLK